MRTFSVAFRLDDLKGTANPSLPVAVGVGVGFRIVDEGISLPIRCPGRKPQES